MESPPLRLLIEFILLAKAALQAKLDLIDPVRKERNDEECIDWSRTRPHASPLRDMVPDLLSPLEEDVYFGWHWDSENAVKVLTASKADDARVDLSHWT
jgi:hypothetical protein